MTFNMITYMRSGSKLDLVDELTKSLPIFLILFFIFLLSVIEFFIFSYIDTHNPGGLRVKTIGCIAFLGVIRLGIKLNTCNCCISNEQESALQEYQVVNEDQHGNLNATERVLMPPSELKI